MHASVYAGVGLAAGALLAGGLAASARPTAAPAASPPSQATVACTNKKGSGVRFVSSASKCKKKQKALTFSKAGPEGPRGPAGPTGARGEAGPSKVIAATNGTLVPIGLGDQRVVAVDVPAGSYAIDASVIVTKGLTDTSYRCDLGSGAGTLQALPLQYSGPSTTISSTGTLVTPVPTQVTLDCGSSFSPAGNAQALVRATKVGEVSATVTP